MANQKYEIKSVYDITTLNTQELIANSLEREIKFGLAMNKDYEGLALGQFIQINQTTNDKVITNVAEVVRIDEEANKVEEDEVKEYYHNLGDAVLLEAHPIISFEPVISLISDKQETETSWSRMIVFLAIAAATVYGAYFAYDRYYVNKK